MAGPDAARTAGSAFFDRLAQRRLLVVSGKGGVGRTTIAALVGLALAQRGRRVLIATTGHDDRLAWMLGAESLSDEAVNVAPGLDVIRLVPQVCVREYGALILRSERLSGAVFDNKIVRRLLRTIPGLDDFAVIGKAWHTAVREDTYDCVVFDGPATGHLIYTLGVPQAILKTIPKGPLTKEAELMQASFEDSSVTQAVLVGLPELWPLTELSELEQALQDRISMSVAGIVVNGVWPSDVPDIAAPAELPDADSPVATVLEQVARMGTVSRRHREAIDTWIAGRRPNEQCPVLELPWCWRGLNRGEDLRVVLDQLQTTGRVHVEAS